MELPKELVADLMDACNAQLSLIAALQNLLACYRIGKRPTERVLDSIQNADEIVSRAKTALRKAGEA